MKNYFLIITLTIAGFVKAQGFNGGFGSGTEFVRLELGYSFSDAVHGGVRFVPGFTTVGIPSYYAGFFRKTFKENDFGGGYINAAFRGYIGGSVGLIRLKGNTLLNGSENKSGFGFSGDLGGEILYGRSGKFGSFFELNLGQVPNYFNTLTNSLDGLYGNTTKTKLAAIWGFNAGIRVYLSK
jgi:hypothetical protein